MRRLSIHFPAAGADVSYVHHVRNLAEDLYRLIERPGLGRVYDMDAAVDVITLDVRPHDLGTVRAIVRKQLAAHGFTHEATVTEE